MGRQLGAASRPMQRSKLRLQTHANEQCGKHGQPKRLRGL